MIYIFFMQAWRRFQAASWLDNMVGPLNLPKEPSEHEFLSCLRNGLVLCNTINRVVPGSVTKVGVQFYARFSSFLIIFYCLFHLCFFLPL